MATNLQTIDPAEAWQPAPSKQWDLKWAAHLYRRAAFGGPPQSFFDGRTNWESLQSAVENGMEASIDLLIEGGAGLEEFGESVDLVGQHIARKKAKLENLQAWWLYRMLHTPHPLTERLTLFWHNHFATSAAKVSKLPLMMRQNILLRRHALGSFREMLLAIGRDPAMLIWLDSNSNVKGRPNENYAREVMELFCLGEGNYTERDIREAARAFTGWGVSGDKFKFSKSQHDNQPKTLLGQSGNWDGDDVVRILLEQEATAQFLVRNLFRQFISESETPPESLLEPLAADLRRSDYDIKTCLRTILSSRIFFSEVAYRQRIKSPVEYVMGLLMAFDIQRASFPVSDLAEAMDGLGQSLFAPPNVKGWDGGRSWLNSATLLSRHNLAWKLTGDGQGHFGEHFKPTELAEKFGKKTHAQQVEFYLDLLLQDDCDDRARQKLVDYFQKTKADEKDQRDKVLRQVIHAILLMPEYQLA